MAIKKSIAIIGEGETEWFYFDSLRTSCRYPFKIAPDIPQHSDIQHIYKMAQQCLARDYDVVVCLIDMDRLLQNPSELSTYQQIKAESSTKILWIETNPCTEFWFLLHFLPELSIKRYKSCDEVLPLLQKYMPGYEKTTRYFRKTKLYEYLCENGDIHRAQKHADQLAALSEANPDDQIAYSQISRVLKLLDEWAAENVERESLKSGFCEPIVGVEAKIVDLLANFPDSNVKFISKAIGLRPSRTSDYLRRLIEIGAIECSESWRKSYRIKC